MPKLIDLQKRFPDQLQILLATSDDPKTVEHFYQRRADLRLPTAVGPDLFDQLATRFGTVTLGSYVWIDQAGRFLTVTDGSQVTEANLQTAISGKIPNLKKKALVRGSEKPLSRLSAGPDEAVVYRSELSSAAPGLLPLVGAPQKLDSGAIRMTQVNATILGLFRLAAAGGNSYGPWGAGIPRPRIIFEIAEPELLTKKRSDADYYCYDLIVPKHLAGNIYEIMRSELERLFPYTGRMEKRKVKSFALVKHGEGPAVSRADSQPVIPGSFMGLDSTLPELAMKLEIELKLPVVDETGLGHKVDLMWQNVPAKDLAGIQAELRKNGLDLLETQREIEVLVIRDSTPLTKTDLK